MAVSERDADGGARVTEGVIDAAVFDGEGWLVRDWKTDDVEDAAWAERAVWYQAQVDRYAAIISRLLGAAATGRVVRTPGLPAPAQRQLRSE